MKKLTTYVLESLNSGSFSQGTDTFDKLINYANHLNAKNLSDVLKPIFDKIAQENTSKTNKVFLWASGKKFFKMDYPFNPIILRIAKEYSDKLDVTIKNNGKKIALYYIGDGKRTKIMETGKGSSLLILSVSTCRVESATLPTRLLLLSQKSSME